MVRKIKKIPGNVEKGKLTCFRCGVCCRRYQVRLSSPEAQHLAENLQVSLNEFIHQYTDSHWPDTETFLLRHHQGSCIFLENTTGGLETRCLIHPFRPQDCREWMPALTQPECQQGLTPWKLTVNAVGELTGSEEDLVRFHSFIKGLI